MQWREKQTGRLTDKYRDRLAGRQRQRNRDRKTEKETEKGSERVLEFGSEMSARGCIEGLVLSWWCIWKVVETLEGGVRPGQAGHCWSAFEGMLCPPLSPNPYPHI